MSWDALRDALVTGGVVILSAFLAAGADLFAVTWDDARLYLAAGLAAVIRTALTALDPKQTSYGKGSHNARN
jgi:hypothetical protein